MCKKANNSKPIKNRKVLTTILDILLVVVSVALFALSGVVFYCKVYLSPFLVNGESMYPTLNKDVVYPNGQKTDGTTGNLSPGCSHVDYGLMDKHKSALNKIKRFDIVVTQYRDNDTSDKIKRVIGLPGETITFTSSNDSTNGDLYIKNGEEFIFVEQPIENKYKIRGDYSRFLKDGPFTLQDDEYLILGDNRGSSADSLGLDYMGIKKSLIIGKAVAIVGHGVAYKDKTDSFQLKNIKYIWPRFL